MLNEARTSLGPTATRDSFLQPVDRPTVKSLHRRARDFQNQFDDQQWGRVRVIHCWPLLLVEQGLTLYLGDEDSPAAGYKLAADFCQHFDSQHGNCLSGPSQTKIMQIVRFMFVVEAIEVDERAR